MAFQQRQLTVHPPAEIGGRQVKRYHVTALGGLIEEEIREATEAFVPCPALRS